MRQDFERHLGPLQTIEGKQLITYFLPLFTLSYQKKLLVITYRPVLVGLIQLVNLTSDVNRIRTESIEDSVRSIYKYMYLLKHNIYRPIVTKTLVL